MGTTVLGRTGLRVSRIALGTRQLGGDWGRFDEAAAVAAIRWALDLGVHGHDDVASAITVIAVADEGVAR